jgi:hypothetical protein
MWLCTGIAYGVMVNFLLVVITTVGGGLARLLPSLVFLMLSVFVVFSIVSLGEVPNGSLSPYSPSVEYLPVQ